MKDLNSILELKRVSRFTTQRHLEDKKHVDLKAAIKSTGVPTGAPTADVTSNEITHRADLQPVGELGEPGEFQANLNYMHNVYQNKLSNL